MALPAQGTTNELSIATIWAGKHEVVDPIQQVILIWRVVSGKHPYLSRQHHHQLKFIGIFPRKKTRVRIETSTFYKTQVMHGSLNLSGLLWWNWSHGKLSAPAVTQAVNAARLLRKKAVAVRGHGRNKHCRFYCCTGCLGLPLLRYTLTIDSLSKQIWKAPVLTTIILYGHKTPMILVCCWVLYGKVSWATVSYGMVSEVNCLGGHW